MSATNLLLVLGCWHTLQIPDRLSLVQVPTGRASATAKLEFMDVFTRGLEGYSDFRWPHITRIPAKGSPGGGLFAGPTDTLLALASGCNATEVCSSAHPWPCCHDTDEQMLMLRRSVDGGRSWSRILYPYLQPQGHTGMPWPFPKNWKAAGQMLWDPKGGRVWLLFSTEQAHDGAGHGCIGDGQTMEGLMMTYSTDLGLSWAAPLNLSTAIAPQWGPSLCIAPAGGNSMLMLDNHESERTLLLLAQIPGTLPGVRPPHGDVTIHITSLPNGPNDTIANMQYNVTLSLTQPCTHAGKTCNFDEAAMAVIPTSATSADTVFVVMRSDPTLTHSYATTVSTDGGYSFGLARFNPELFSVACEPSAVWVVGGSNGAGGLFVAAPHIGHKPILPHTSFSDRSNMTVMARKSSINNVGPAARGGQWEVLRSVYAGPSMYSNLADGGDGNLLLFFERAGA